MVSIKPKNIEVVAVTIVIAIMLIAGQMQANAEKEEDLSASPRLHTSINSSCCISTETKVNNEQAKELTFGATQCPNIPLTMTLTTINKQIEACLLHEKHRSLSHILNSPSRQAPSVQHKNSKLPKRVNSKAIDTFYKAPKRIKF